MQTIKLINNEIAQIIDTEQYKVLKSTNYNYFFSKKDGIFVRWGKAKTLNKIESFTKFEQQLYLFWCEIWNEKITLKQFMNDIKTDGDFNITAPEIVDWEISELCNANCKFCYKSNVDYKGNDISFDDFKKTFNKLPPSVTTIAYGIGSISLCKNLFNILEYTRNNGIIPTITINGDATDNELEKLVKYCGAIAVSVYNKNKSYNCVKRLTDLGLEQCNLHVMISEETFDKTINILKDVKTDPRLKKLKSVVLLSLKEKGRSVGNFHQLSQDKFEQLFQYAIDNNVNIGFDSCSAAKAKIFIDKNSNYQYMNDYIEPCEASKYSTYINVNCEYFPCSFTENTTNWKTGINVKECNDFMKDIWFNEKTLNFGECVEKCRNCNIGCPIYKI